MRVQISDDGNGQVVARDFETGEQIEGVVALSWLFREKGGHITTLRIEGAALDAELDLKGEWIPKRIVTAEDGNPLGLPEGTRYAVVPDGLTEQTGLSGYATFPARVSAETYVNWRKASQALKQDPENDLDTLAIHYRIFKALTQSIHLEREQTMGMPPQFPNGKLAGFNTFDYDDLIWMKSVAVEFVADFLTRVKSL